MNNPKFFCEDCAIKNWQKDYGFKTRTAAAAHRRRMFDVSYLFLEMWVDEYLKAKNLKDPDDLEDGMIDNLFNRAQDIYNEKISKKKKQDLWCYFYQRDIEKYLKKIINKYFDL